ncbi:MAG: KUP/HAK/KT family potassium transporter [Bacteroidota bacterium]
MNRKIKSLTAGGVLVAIGIIYGDIGTSPLYVFNAIIGNRVISPELVLGALSCIFWTLTLITSLKYIYLALNADNKGEGGIFALYALVRKGKARWVIYPAIIGCCTLLADGFLTPAISISAAIEGLILVYPTLQTTKIVMAIMVALFLFQQFNSGTIAKSFGSIMLLWFSTIGIFGLLQWMHTPEVFKAINPSYAWAFVTKYPGGFWLLGAVFLCTTGAEALYSDLGLCGKQNMRVSWGLIKVCLLSNYFGQAAWLLQQSGKQGLGQSFFLSAPEGFLWWGILIATLATLVGSQALISGTFTLVSEAIKLKLWPNSHVRYLRQRGQIYIPSINWILMAGCLTVLWIFQESTKMESAYGLAIILNMLMTTTLLVYYYKEIKISLVRTISLVSIFFLVEGIFLISNLNKFLHGGWFTYTIAIAFFSIMFLLHKARQLRQEYREFVSLKDYIPLLQELQADTSVPKEATHLVYMSVADSKKQIDACIVYSIFRKRPKRADVYWFLHVDTMDSPYTSKYLVDTIIPKKCFFVRIQLGYKAEYKVNLIFTEILRELSEKGEIELGSPYPSLHKHNLDADFKFIILFTRASVDNEISTFDHLVIQGYRFIKKISLSAEAQFGLELANVEEETVPIMIGPPAKVSIVRENEKTALEKEMRYYNPVK